MSTNRPRTLTIVIHSCTNHTTITKFIINNNNNNNNKKKMFQNETDSETLQFPQFHTPSSSFFLFISNKQYIISITNIWCSSNLNRYHFGLTNGKFSHLIGEHQSCEQEIWAEYALFISYSVHFCCFNVNSICIHNDVSAKYDEIFQSIFQNPLTLAKYLKTL